MSKTSDISGNEDQRIFKHQSKPWLEAPEQLGSNGC